MKEVLQGWSSGNLSDVAKWGSGGTPQARNPAYYGGDIPWAVIGDLNDSVVTQTRATITTAGLEASSAKIVPEGAILVAMYGSIGKLGIAGRAISTNQAIAFALPNQSILPRYLFYYLLSQRHALNAAGKGAAQRNISQTVLKSWPIQFPKELDEQQRIVDILEDHLSRLEAAAGLMSSAEHRLQALRRSALTAVINRPDRETAPLRFLVKRIEAGKSFGGAAPPASADEWGIIKVSAMTWGLFKPEENKAVPADSADSRYEIRVGDLLVSRANTSAYVGASVLVGAVRPRLLLSDKSLRVVPDDGIDRHWLWLALSSPDARAQISAKATGTKDSMRNISQAGLLDVEVPHVPPTDQQADVARLSMYFDSIAHLAGALGLGQRKREALRDAVLAAAFSGRLIGRASDMEIVEEMAGV